jgi:ketosteroid isomerase-like protein
VRVAQAFFRSFFAGDVTEATAVLHPEVRYRVASMGKTMTTYQGVTEVIDHLHSFLKAIDAVDVLQWEDWLSGVNNVAGLARVHLQHDNRLHDFRLVGFARVEDGLIEQIDIFFDDPEAFNRFLNS